MTTLVEETLYVAMLGTEVMQGHINLIDSYNEIVSTDYEGYESSFHNCVFANLTADQGSVFFVSNSFLSITTSEMDESSPYKIKNCIASSGTIYLDSGSELAIDNLTV